MVLIVLNLISERGEPYIIPLLLKWKEVEVRKIRNGIEQAVRSINERHVAGAPEVEASEDMYFDFRLPE